MDSKKIKNSTFKENFSNIKKTDETNKNAVSHIFKELKTSGSSLTKAWKGAALYSTGDPGTTGAGD